MTHFPKMTPNHGHGPRKDLNPDEHRNMLIFMVLAIGVYLLFNHFFFEPQRHAIEAQRLAQQTEAAQKTAGPAGITAPETVQAAVPRTDAITGDTRLEFENAAISGSINLRGGRIDDVSLKNYYETLDHKNKVVLMSPSGTEFPRYAEFGWVAGEDAKNQPLPDAGTLWRLSGSKKARLTPETPVTLYWENGQGLRFERTYTMDDDFLITVSQKAVNRSGKDVTLFPYALISQKGLPREFTNVWVVHEGPIGYLTKELFERPYKKMAKDGNLTRKAEEGWIGITDKYWLTALLPDQTETKTFRFIYAGSGSAKELEAAKYQTDILGAARKIAPGAEASTEMRLFAGAKRLTALDAYEQDLGLKHFDLALDFGMYYFMTKPFFHVLHFFGNLTGNFGIAIILFTILLRAAVFPLANTSYKSFAKMKQISPQIAELRTQYGDDKETLQKELVKLYQKEQVNPASGCLPILIQIPIFFALYKVLYVTLEMRHAPFYGWIEDLSAPDPTNIFELFGLVPWGAPDMLHVGAWPVFMLLAMILQRKLNPPPPDPVQAQIIAVMPFFMAFIMAKFAAGLVIYWTFSAFFSVLQQYIIMRRMGVEVHLFSGNGENKTEKVKEKKEKEKEKETEEAKDAPVPAEKPKEPVKPPKPKAKRKKKT